MNSRRERLCKKAGLAPEASQGFSGDFCQLRRNRITANVRLQSSSVSDKTEASTHIGLEAAIRSNLIRNGNLGSTVGLKFNAEQ